MSFRAYFFDLDGTLYRGAEPIPHAADCLRRLRGRGAKIRFLTNNSGATPDDVARKLSNMDMPASSHEVITSGMAAASYCRHNGLKRLFVVGEPGLVQVLSGAGLTVVNARADGSGVEPAEDVLADAVVNGICRQFTYDLLNAALQHLLRGASFVATNPDPTYPMEAGRLEPGAGSLVAALRTAAGRDPYVAGKPQPDMVRLALESCEVSPTEALVIGDRIDTDVAAGEAAGCRTLLVMTGVTADSSRQIGAIRDLRELEP